MEDAVNQFHHLSVMADSQKAYLQGAIEFYQARTNTKMTVAAERLAVIAAVTLPITALSSVLGMNLIVNDGTLWYGGRHPGCHAGHIDDAAGLGERKGWFYGERARGTPRCAPARARRPSRRDREHSVATIVAPATGQLYN